jgi:hypothetical protein
MRQRCFELGTGRYQPQLTPVAAVARSLATEDRVPQLLELAANVGGQLPATFGGRGYSEGSEQVGGGSAGITRLAEDRVQALRRQVMKHQIHDAPRVKGLALVG